MEISFSPDPRDFKLAGGDVYYKLLVGRIKNLNVAVRTTNRIPYENSGRIQGKCFERTKSGIFNGFFF